MTEEIKNNTENLEATENKEDVDKGSEEQAEKTFTESEVMEMLQKESDRRVTSALNKQKKKYEEKLSLSKLDESERATAEKDLKIKELEEQLQNYHILENKNEVIKVLNARGLNPEFADLIEIGDDIDEAQAKLDKLDKLFKDAVSQEVKKRLASGTPTGSNEGSSETITKDSFKKMSLAQQAELYKKDQELFRKLSK
jgi:hypothetical protein